jgi:hypothetical protein
MYVDWPDDTHWQDIVREALDPNSTVEIHFSLAGIDDANAYAKLAEGVSSPGYGQYTPWELAQIKAAPESVQSRVIWYDKDGKVTKNPFE